MTGQTIYEGITLHNGDCRDIMREMPADHFDAIITDPPYGIAFKGEKWDTATPRGFQSWCESWAVEALRIVKPGGYLLAFSAPRTYHRLAAGSGTTLQAAAMEGVNAVGCELDARYIPLIHERFRRGIDAPLDFLI